MKIMIVEDDEDVRNSVEHLLVKSGHEVVSKAGDGAEAIEQFKENRPSLVIMDIILPREHGIKAIEEIINIDPFAKIIVITGVANEILINKALNAGAIAFLPKPFGAEELLGAINEITKVEEQ